MAHVCRLSSLFDGIFVFGIGVSSWPFAGDRDRRGRGRTVSSWASVRVGNEAHAHERERIRDSWSRARGADERWLLLLCFLRPLLHCASSVVVSLDGESSFSGDSFVSVHSLPAATGGAATYRGEAATHETILEQTHRRRVSASSASDLPLSSPAVPHVPVFKLFSAATSCSSAEQTADRTTDASTNRVRTAAVGRCGLGDGGRRRPRHDADSRQTRTDAAAHAHADAAAGDGIAAPTSPSAAAAAARSCRWFARQAGSCSCSGVRSLWSLCSHSSWSP